MGNKNSGRYPRLNREERRLIINMSSDGHSAREIAKVIGRSSRIVSRTRREHGGVARRQDWDPSPSRLSAREREEIRAGLEHGHSIRHIAATLERSPSTISREVNNNGGRSKYQAWRAHRRAEDQARRPRSAKLVANPRLRNQVEEWLLENWSPKQIAERLRHEFPDDPMMRVSTETIYQSLYVQGRGALRKELAACLRSGRAIRKNQSRLNDNRGRIPDMVMISERPAEVEDRAVPGHWEGDLIIGKNNKSAIGTLVERSTRFVMLLHLDGKQDAETVRLRMAEKIQQLPAQLAKSITWDQGKEMSQHAQFTIDTGVDVYFCDPRSPWQRGSNENTNGLLRQYLPKGTDLSVHSEADLDEIARSLNGRPRQTLGWLKPSERFAQLVATTG